MLGSGGCMISNDGVLVPAHYTGHNAVSLDCFGLESWEVIKRGGIRISIDREKRAYLTLDLTVVTEKAIDQLKAVYKEFQDTCVILTSEFVNIDWDKGDRCHESDWQEHKPRFREIMQAPKKRAMEETAMMAN